MMRGLVALSSQETFGFAIGAIVLVGFFVGLGYASRRAWGDTRRKPDIPSAMRPAPADAELEKPRLEKLQGWALASFLFLAIWIPVAWLNEPSTNQSQERTLEQESVNRGAKEVKPFSESNIFGVGCERCHGEGLAGGQNLFNGAIVPVPSLQEVCGGPNSPGLPVPIHNSTDLRNIIERGIPGTDMPSWSVRFAGGLDDQQIDDLVLYVIKMDQKYVKFKENVCINSNAKGYELPVEPAT
ncbi:MAG: cytochrome c [Actinomycetota bacterium]